MKPLYSGITKRNHCFHLKSGIPGQLYTAEALINTHLGGGGGIAVQKQQEILILVQLSLFREQTVCNGFAMDIS